MRFLADIKEGEQVVEHYYCKQKQTLKSRAGKSYLSLKLQDKTGIVDAKVWDLNNDIKAFEENEFIKIDGVALIYQNEVQLKVSRVRRSMEGEYDPVDYIPSTEKNVDELYQKLLNFIESIENTFIKNLVENIMLHNQQVNNTFKTHSAAKTMHHNYMGGLLEHTISVTEICDFMSRQYPLANRDILIATAILHDVGKVFELSAFPVNDYTDDGQLLGHLIIGMELMTKEAEKIPDFPPELLSIIKHSMLSHHGEYEYGSPQLPKTIEAFILHCADNADAKIKMIEDCITEDNTQGNWVGYHKMLGRNIRKTKF